MPILPSLMATLRHILHPADACDDWRDDEDTDDVAAFACIAGPPTKSPSIEDLRRECSDVTYSRGASKGKRKRDLYRRADLAMRETVICLHQTGVNRADASSRHKLITAHFVVTPLGRILWLYDLDVRLIAANRLDREPYHAISIEFVGNFEGVDGDGRWFAGDKFGRGRPTDAQLASGRWLVRHLLREVARKGSSVAAIVPHRIAGRDSHGRPNRQLCPGSRIWQGVGEAVAATDGVRVPAPDAAVGGAPIPDSWRGPHHETLRRLGLDSWRAL
jgi:hypothetical protein